MKIGTRPLVILTGMIYLSQFCWYALTQQWGRFAGLLLVLLAGVALALTYDAMRRRKATQR